MKRAIVAAAALAWSAGAAFAQQQDVRIMMSSPQSAVSAHNQVRVNVSTSLFVPSPATPAEQGLEAQENARRKMYEVAVRECVVLREVIASDCRVETINISMNRRQGPQQAEGFTVGANMNFRITLK